MDAINNSENAKLIKGGLLIFILIILLFCYWMIGGYTNRYLVYKEICDSLIEEEKDEEEKDTFSSV